ncbi:MAG: BppU family phage baseplate upper protein [Acutalibacteraceae bacterium]|nr:BppU family phage baseplate upper protein [Acutalibacteraceae bacterium]
MERVEHRIKLNLMKTGLQGQVNVKKADTDSRKVCIYLSYAAKPFDLNDVVSAVLRAEKPDGNVMFNNCTVCEDRLEYIITTQTIASIGTVTCEITLTSGSGQVLVTPRFEIIVSETIYSDSEIESTDEYTALTETLKKAASLKDGITPTIGENGNWYLGETDTGKPSRGEKGDTGASGEPGKDGTNGSPGADGLTPTIGENGNWYFDDVDTGKPSRGLQGEKGTAFQYSDFTSEQLAALKGEPGSKGETGVGIATCNLFYQYGNSNVTPPTGSWTAVIPSSATGEYLWTRIQFTYTGGKSPTFIALVTKQGKDGTNGITPTIGTNGNWYLGVTDTGKPSRGEKGDKGDTGADGKTPVKGTDYWTAADKAEIVNDTLAALPTWTGGNY